MSNPDHLVIPLTVDLPTGIINKAIRLGLQRKTSKVHIEDITDVANTAAIGHAVVRTLQSSSVDDLIELGQTARRMIMAEQHQDETPQGVRGAQDMQDQSGTTEAFRASQASDSRLITLANIKTTKYFPLQVRGCTTVLQLAQMVEEHEEIPIKNFNLLHNKVVRIFGGETEENQDRVLKTLEEVGVQDGNLITIVLNEKLRPGCYTKVTEGGKTRYVLTKIPEE